MKESNDENNSEQESKLIWSKPECKKLDLKETAGGPGLDDESNASKSAS